MDNNDVAAESGEVLQPSETGTTVGQAEKELSTQLGQGGKYARFTMAALGSIPWIGSFLSALASLEAETQQDEVNKLMKLWMEEHKEKIQELEFALQDIYTRFDALGEQIQERIQSPAYLTLVRLTFRSWDQAETKEKREMYKKLITNAGGKQLTSDDLDEIPRSRDSRESS